MIGQAPIIVEISVEPRRAIFLARGRAFTFDLDSKRLQKSFDLAKDIGVQIPVIEFDLRIGGRNELDFFVDSYRPLTLIR